MLQVVLSLAQVIDNDEKCQPTQVHFEKVKNKQILFPQVRNIDQENDPIYETEKCVYVNPNSFERVEKVFEEVQKRTNTYGNDTSFLTISEVKELPNVRQYLVITVDLRYKLNLNIDKFFGTAIWLVRAGHRANYFKLYKAGMRVFLGCFI